MFLYQALHKEKETSYLTLCMTNFGLMATSLMASLELRQYQSLSQMNFFSS